MVAAKGRRKAAESRARGTRGAEEAGVELTASRADRREAAGGRLQRIMKNALFGEEQGAKGAYLAHSLQLEGPYDKLAAKADKKDDQLNLKQLKAVAVCFHKARSPCLDSACHPICVRGLLSS